MTVNNKKMSTLSLEKHKIMMITITTRNSLEEEKANQSNIIQKALKSQSFYIAGKRRALLPSRFPFTRKHKNSNRLSDPDLLY